MCLELSYLVLSWLVDHIGNMQQVAGALLKVMHWFYVSGHR